MCQIKVRRYWPGKAPEWTTDTQSQIVDCRVRRLEIVVDREEESRGQAEEEDEDVLEERRRRLIEKLLRRQQEAVALSKADEQEDEESEYETDSKDPPNPSTPPNPSRILIPLPRLVDTWIWLVKPVFVRNTRAKRERLEVEEQALEEAARRRLEEREVETKQILVEKIRGEQEIQKNLEAEEEANIADFETDDELKEAEENERWKARETARIKRDREAREATLKIEKVRNMTEEERKNPSTLVAAAKQKWRFMQKYYHKGAFFQSDADEQAGTATRDSPPRSGG